MHETFSTIDRNRLIWVVDDDPSISEALYIMLTESGYAVETFNKSTTLFERLAEKKPNLIMMDMLLDEEDGKEIALKIKSRKDTGSIQIILMSASNQLNEMELVKKYKIAHFMGKPFDMTKMLALVKSCIS